MVTSPSRSRVKPLILVVHEFFIELYKHINSLKNIKLLDVNSFMVTEGTIWLLLRIRDLVIGIE